MHHRRVSVTRYRCGGGTPALRPTEERDRQNRRALQHRRYRGDVAEPAQQSEHEWLSGASLHGLDFDY